ncbi:hypothetical protein ACLBKT_15195 [Erythrobacter sp. W302b]|uniref:hypothetical protein n=1 Tax=Erythrobacter sp. W302b TaxID=3389874 RepID=UPI00396B08C3
MALHRQTTAFFWPIGRESGDDDKCTEGGSSSQRATIGGPLLRLGQEMEDGPVMPYPVAARRVPAGYVGDLPVDARCRLS